MVLQAYGMIDLKLSRPAIHPDEVLMRLTLAFALLFAAANRPTDSAIPSADTPRRTPPWKHNGSINSETFPERDRIRESMKRLSARPHHVGSAYDKDNAEWLLAQLKSYGLDAQIETFDHALSHAQGSRSLELLGPAPFKAKLQEPVVSIDPTSNQTAEQLPTYNAYSRDGDVTAPLVYVNYGRPGGLRTSSTAWAFA